MKKKQQRKKKETKTPHYKDKKQLDLTVKVITEPYIDKKKENI